VRAKFRIVEGQKFYVVPSGNDLLLKPVPDDPARRLTELLGKDFVFDRETRRKAEEWLLNESGIQNKARKIKKR